jgi:pilus assembly protein CpaB
MPKKTIMVFSLFSLLIGIVASSFIYVRIVKPRSVHMAVHPDPLVEIVVAGDRLAPGTRLERSNLKTISWPKRGLPEGYLASIEPVVGRVLVTSVTPNEPILERKLAPEDAGAGLAAAIEQGKLAVSVKVNEVSGVAGFAIPGAHVDVLVVASHRPSHEPMAKTVLQNVPVLAAGQQTEQNSEGKPVNATVATLLVTPEDGERLALAAHEGKIQLALRHPVDHDRHKTAGTQLSALLGGDRAPERPRIAKPSAAKRVPTAVEIMAGTKRTVQEFTCAAN